MGVLIWLVEGGVDGSIKLAVIDGCLITDEAVSANSFESRKAAFGQKRTINQEL